MHKKQKINLASRLIARELLPLHKYFQDQEQFKQFHHAQQEERVAAFFMEEMTHLSGQKREQLALYYELSEKISAIGVDRYGEILRIPLSDKDSYEKACDRGIVTEKQWLVYEFEDQTTPNRNKVMQLIQEEIDILDEHVDLILSLDPELDILKRFDELPAEGPDDEYLFQALQDKRWVDLGQAVLRRLKPDNYEQLLDIEDELKMVVLRGIQKDISYWLRNSFDLDEQQKQAIMQNQELFLQYLGEGEDHQYPAYLALIYDSTPAYVKSTPEYIVQMWRLGDQYSRMSLLSDWDYEALVRLYEYIETNFGIVRDAPDFDSQKMISLQIIMRNQLASYYRKLWEWEKAVEKYKINAVWTYTNGLHKDFEKALFSIADCLQEFQKNNSLVKYLVNILEGNGEDFDNIPDGFQLSDVTRKACEGQLITALETQQIHPNELKEILKNIKTKPGKIFSQLMEGLKSNDELPIASIQAFAAEFEKFYSEDMNGFFDGPSQSAGRITNALHKLKMFEVPVESYRESLKEIEKYIEDQTADIRLDYDLHCALLQYYEKDAACIEAFAKLVPLTARYPSFFNKHLQAFWHNQFIRVASLSINEGTDLWEKIESAAIKSVNFISEGFLDNYHENTARLSMVSELENTAKALLLNIERTDYYKTRQHLLKLLWNVLIYQQQFFNRFIGKENISIQDDKKYDQIFKKNKEQLFEYHVLGRRNVKADLHHNSAQLLALEKSHLRTAHRFEKFFKPKERSILFHFFIKMNHQRHVLMLEAKPADSLSDGLPIFDYVALDAFEEIETLVQEIENEHQFFLNQDGMLVLLDSEEGFNKIAGPLKYFFNVSEDEGFRDRLKDLLVDEFIDKTSEAASINLYCDDFLHQFPFEIMELDTGEVVGCQFNIANAIKAEQSEDRLFLPKGIAIFSGIPTLGRLNALENSTEEHASIKNLFETHNYPVFSYGGEKATLFELNQLLRNRKPSILHLATHGVADDQLPAESASLILTPQENNPASALLTYEDIIRQDYSGVDLVVLSACNGSVGQVNKGSAIQGLAYAFLSAGASFVLASRAPVNDKQTLKFMKKFYEYLFETGVKDAMRRTRQYFMENKGQVNLRNLAAWGVWT